MTQKRVLKKTPKPAPSNIHVSTAIDVVTTTSITLRPIDIITLLKDRNIMPREIHHRSVDIFTTYRDEDTDEIHVDLNDVDTPRNITVMYQTKETRKRGDKE